MKPADTKAAAPTERGPSGGGPLYVPLRAQLIQRVPWFFKPAFECLGFLSRDYGFSYDGESPGGPDDYARVVFEDDGLRIEVMSWFPMDLPALTVRGLRRNKRKILDLKALAPDCVPESDRGDFYERYMRVHPLNKEGRAEIDREFEAALARRMAQFGEFLRARLDVLRRAA